MPPVAPQTSTLVALLHPGAVVAHEHAVRRRVAQRVDRRLLPREVGGLRHQLVGLHDREVGEAAEVRLEPPDPLVAGEHRVVVGRRVLIVDVVAVHRRPGRRASSCAPPSRPAAPRPRRRNRPRGTAARGACPTRSPAEPVEEPERGERLEDRRPHRVEVDRARRHHREVHLVGGELRRGHLVDVQRLPRVLVGRRHPLEHRGLVAPDERGPVALGDREGGELVADWHRPGSPRGCAAWRATLPIGNADEQSDPASIASRPAPRPNFAGSGRQRRIPTLSGLLG